MSEYEKAGCELARGQMLLLLQEEVAQRTGAKLVKDYQMTYNNIRDLKLKQTPSISFDRMIRHLRLFGHEVVITVDGITLPMGDLPE